MNLKAMFAGLMPRVTHARILYVHFYRLRFANATPGFVVMRFPKPSLRDEIKSRGLEHRLVSFL